MDIFELEKKMKDMGFDLTGRELSKLMGMTEQGYSNKKCQENVSKNIKLKYIRNIEKNLNISLLTPDENATEIAKEVLHQEYEKQTNEHYPPFDIAYWEELPEDLKKNDFTNCHVDWEVMVNYWKFDAKNIRVLPIFTKLLTYYPAERFPFGHIALMDISSTDIQKEGVYCFTTDSGVFIRALTLLMDGSVQFMDYSEQTPKILKVVPPEKLQQVNFKVVGRVFKCVTTRI